MAKFDWKSVLGTVAPTLATALGGPLAGVAVKALSEKLLGKDTGTEDEVAAAIVGANPETLMKLKQAEFDFRKAMEELDIERDKLAFGDRASAREREVKTGDNWTPRLLAFVILLGWISLQWFLLHEIVPEQNKDLIMRGMGILDIAVGLVLGYYFGSSAGSKQKNELLESKK
jgi:hypothetical protein